MRRPPQSSAFAGALVVALASVTACADRPTEPVSRASLAPSAPRLTTAAPDGTTAERVRRLAAGRGIVPLARPAPVREPLVRLGQALLFDRTLSGNRDIACSTCHLPSHATADGRSLSVGQGAEGLGPLRLHPRGALIARNAPPLFNLGVARRLFWDGRVEREASGNLATPARAHLTPAMRRTFEFGPISALAMFPVTNRAEMRGDDGPRNELAAIPDADFGAIWAAIMRRLGGIPEYRGMFEAAYPGTRFAEMTFAHASNAIAGFIVDRMTFADTPWDRFLRGDDAALTASQLEGAETFLALRCSICHNGPTLSDDDFHNVAVAQIGPGAGDGVDGRDDFGRMRVTGRAEDRYRFRTTPLRNVELTAPYGHSGSILTLRAFIEHYSESDFKLRAFDASPLDAPLRGTLQPNAAAILATRDTLLNGVVLTPALVDQLTAYMGALTDAAARDLSRLAPRRVPSRLAVDR
jgi:cytochrome c peroxidase